MMTRGQLAYIFLLFAAVIFVSASHAVAGAEDPPPATCEMDRPAGFSVSGTAAVVLFNDSTADVTFKTQFDGRPHIFRAHVPIDTISFAEAICSMLHNQFSTAAGVTTLSQQIVTALGQPDRTLKITARSVSGWLCPPLTPGIECSALVGAGQSNRPEGASLAPIPGTASGDRRSSAIAEVTLYAVPQP
jgi:hypothetical protein